MCIKVMSMPTYTVSGHTHFQYHTHFKLASFMPPDSDKIDLVNPLTFKKEEWIGKKHMYIFTSSSILCDKSMRQGSQDPLT